MSNQFELAGTRGHSYIWEHKWKEAIQEFKLALEGLPDVPGLHDGLATAYREVGDFPQALTHFRKAVELSDREAIYLEQLADLQQKTGDLEGAAVSLLEVGEARLKQNRLDDAIDMWLLSARLNPNLLKSHERLATVYHKQKKTFQAVNAFLEVARIYELHGQLNRTLKACQMALKLDPRNPVALTAIELLRAGERAFDEQAKRTNITTLSRDTKPSPSAEVIESKSKDVLLVKNLIDSSRERMAAEIMSGNSGPEGMQHMATLSQALDYQTRGKAQEAIEAYESVLDNNSRSTIVLFNLGYLYQETNQFDKGIELFTQLLNDQDYHLASLYLLGDSYRALGRMREAVQHFMEVVLFMDLPTVPPGQVAHIKALYQELRTMLTTNEREDQANEFANSLTDLLSRPAWEKEVARAREKLDGLSGMPGSMILGEILLTGSARILESLYLAQEYTQSGFFDAALEEIYRAIEISPSYLPAHIEMADLLVKQNRLSQAANKLNMIGDTFMVRGDRLGAIGAYRRGVKAFPLNTDLRNNLMTLLKQENMTTEIIEQYAEQADAFYQMAQIDRARQSYMDGLRITQKEAIKGDLRLRLLKGLGDIELQRLNWKQALPIFQELRRAQPNNKDVIIGYIELLYKSGNPEPALKEVDRLLVTFVKQKRTAEVVKLVERLVNERPNDAQLVNRLVKLYLHQKESAHAIKVLDRLGEYQLENGDIKGATKTVSQILALKPADRTAYEQLLAELKRS